MVSPRPALRDYGVPRRRTGGAACDVTGRGHHSAPRRSRALRSVAHAGISGAARAARAACRGASSLGSDDSPGGSVWTLRRARQGRGVCGGCKELAEVRAARACGPRASGGLCRRRVSWRPGAGGRAGPARLSLQELCHAPNSGSLYLLVPWPHCWGSSHPLQQSLRSAGEARDLWESRACPGSVQSEQPARAREPQTHLLTPSLGLGPRGSCLCCL